MSQFANCILKNGSPFVEDGGLRWAATTDLPARLEQVQVDGSATISLFDRTPAVRVQVNYDHLRPIVVSTTASVPPSTDTAQALLDQIEEAKDSDPALFSFGERYGRIDACKDLAARLLGPEEAGKVAQAAADAAAQVEADEESPAEESPDE